MMMMMIKLTITNQNIDLLVDKFNPYDNNNEEKY